MNFPADEFPGNGFQGDIDYLNSYYDAGEPAEIRLLKAILAAGGGVGASQLATKAPALARGAYGVLKGLGNAGEMALGGVPEGVGGVKNVTSMLKGLTVPEELSETVIPGKKLTDLITVFKKGSMGGGISPNTGKALDKVNIWGVEGPKSVLKNYFGSESPASVPEELLLKLGFKLPE